MASSRSACRWSAGTEKNPCTCGECRVMVSTRSTPAVTSRSATRRPAMEILGSSFLSDLAYAKCGITAVTRAAEAPRAASAISSSSTRCSWTGLTRGWMRNTSRSRQLDWSWTSRQSLANRVSRTGRSGTDRYRQISAVSARCALPPNTTISRTPGFLPPRQAEPLPDLGLDGLGRRPRVDGDDVLLAAEQVEHRGGLLVIVPQADGQRLVGVVFPGRQLSPAGVALPGHRRGAVDQVVVDPASLAHPAAQHPPADLAVRQVELDHAVDVVALDEELGLPAVPREPVDDEAVVPVVPGQPVPDDRLHQVVPDQFPGRHDAAHLRAYLGVVLHVPAEDVSHADVHQVQVGRQHLALRALAAALDAHYDVLAHSISLAYRQASRPCRAASVRPRRWRAQPELALAGPPYLAADQYPQLRPVLA